MSPSLAGVIGAITFWTFVGVCAVTGMVRSMLRHRETQKTIRQAIDSGQQLDPRTLEMLLQFDKPPKGPPSRSFLLFGGIMLLALAGGLCVIGWAVSMQSHDPNQLYPGLGAGALVGMLGVGLLVANAAIGKSSGDKPE